MVKLQNRKIDITVLNADPEQEMSLKNENIADETILDVIDSEVDPKTVVGKKLREIRTRRGLSLRTLAESSGLNINTLSLIENSKSSPSVSTLQQLAAVLEVPITAFFESEPQQKQVVFVTGDKRPCVEFKSTCLENLGKDLKDQAVQPFIVTMEAGSGSGSKVIVHTGHEFVYCLSGIVKYMIDEQVYLLKEGDSIVFEAHLPHRWNNNGSQPAKIILVLIPTDQREAPGGRHFPIFYE